MNKDKSYYQIQMVKATELIEKWAGYNVRKWAASTILFTKLSWELGYIDTNKADDDILRLVWTYLKKDK